jgi:hypothetical protein
VVRETVLAAAGAAVRAAVVPEAGLCVCADAILAVAQTRMARNRFFTVFSISGGDKNYLILLIIFVDMPRNEKNNKG